VVDVPKRSRPRASPAAFSFPPLFGGVIQPSESVAQPPAPMTLAFKHRDVPDSPLARWDARWKLAALALAACGVAALDRLLPSAVALAIGLLLVALTRLPGKWVRDRLGLFALAALPFLLVLPFTLDL